MSLSLTFGVGSCLLALVAGYWFVPFLRRRGVGKKVRVDGPSTHMEKTGTPTMGGLLICGVALVVTAIATFFVYPDGGKSILLPLGVLVSCAILGAIDDRMSLQGGRGGGLSMRFKMGWLTAIGLLAAIALWHAQLLGIDYLFMPTLRDRIHLPFWLFVPLAIFAIVGCANAVNFTDGLDSLAGVTAFVAFCAFGVIAYLYEQNYLVTFCFTVAGATAGFLWFNAHPAEVFMGDTGSLALGATLAVVALMVGQVLLLPIIGLVFVAEVISVVLQVAYYKRTGGKRLFRMAPLHHHFELLGWSETQVTQRFWLVSVLAGMLGVALALI
ncbi:MAG: phospho-N-acetylmuramoyl-pentapeptide-transferase [Chloroflexota bacterium]